MDRGSFLEANRWIQPSGREHYIIQLRQDNLRHLSLNMLGIKKVCKHKPIFPLIERYKMGIDKSIWMEVELLCIFDTKGCLTFLAALRIGGRIRMFRVFSLYLFWFPPRLLSTCVKFQISFLCFPLIAFLQSLNYTDSLNSQHWLQGSECTCCTCSSSPSCPSWPSSCRTPATSTTWWSTGWSQSQLDSKLTEPQL